MTGRSGSKNVAGTDQKLALILVRAGLIDDMQLKSAQAHQSKWGGKLHHIVSFEGFASQEAVADALAKGLNMPRLDPARIGSDKDALALLDAAMCQQHLLYPCALRDNGKTLWLATTNPLDIEVMDEVQRRSQGARIQPGIATIDQIKAAISQGYKLRVEHAKPVPEAISLDSSAADDSDEEFKIVDSRGKTSAEHQPQLPKKQQAPTYTPEAMSEQEVFASTSAKPAPSPLEDLQFLLSLENNNSNRELKAIIELCVRKGLFSSDAYQRAVASKE
jgi:hypothetical protein